MLTQTTGTQRLYHLVAEQIADLIRRRQFHVGSRLPPERDLARQLAVSRPTVREALVALEIAGLVEVRTGSGAYVCRLDIGKNGNAAPAKVTDAGPSPFELIAARRMVEPATAGLAAISATKKDIAEIREVLEVNERVVSGTHWERLEADRQLHQRLAEATHNATIVRMVVDLWKDMFGPIFAVLSERTELAHKKMLTMQDHRTIVSCIERRDPAGAEAAMLSHLVHAEMKLQSGAPKSERAASRARRPIKPASRL